MEKQVEQPQYIIGHLDWETRARFTLAILIACLLLGTLGYNILQPWDPLGAISLIVCKTPIITLIELSALLIVVGIFSTVIISARLPLFGIFAGCLGVGIPIIKTGTMDYLMVRLQTGKELEHNEVLWIYLLFETFLWLIPWITLIITSYSVEHWLNSKTTKATKDKQSKAKFILQAIIGNIFVVIFAIAFISILATNSSKGQVVFATFAGFFLATLVSDQLIPIEKFPYHLFAVPLTAIIAFLYTYLHPDRPPGFEMVLHITPNNMVKVLPIEYIFIGSAGCILGLWYSIRLKVRIENE